MQVVGLTGELTGWEPFSLDIGIFSESSGTEG